MAVLGDLVTTHKGLAFKSSWYQDSGIPIVRVTDFTSNSIAKDALKYISESLAKSYAKYQLKAGDILVQTVGSWPSNPKSVVGKAVRVPVSLDGALLNQNIVKLIPRQGINDSFVFYLLKSKSYLNYIGNTAQGAASQASITLESLLSFPIPNIGSTQQNTIAAHLLNYDQLIENNEERIRCAENLLHEIYREWFVRFRFPNHQNIKLIESHIGLIPTGWDCVAVSKAVHINPTTRVPDNKVYKYIPMAGLTKNSMLITTYEYRTTKSGSKFKNNDTLFARITPSAEHGKTGFVQMLDNDEVAIGSTEFIVMRSATLSPYYVYCLARDPRLRAHAIKSMSGASGRQRIQDRCFDAYYIAHPTENLINTFSDLVSPIFKQINTLYAAQETLKLIRDTLLLKFISEEAEA